MVFPACYCGVALGASLSMDLIFVFRQETGTCRHNRSHASRCEKLMHSETVLVNTLEYKGDALGKHSRNSLYSAAPWSTSYACAANPIGQLLSGYFFSMGAVTLVYPLVAMASALTLLPLWTCWSGPSKQNFLFYRKAPGNKWGEAVWEM